MKPDKHKQKKSQQYKKKHDVKSVKDEKTHKSVRKGTVQTPAQASRGVQHANPTKATVTALVDSASSEEDCEKVFHRRGLKSNWERYQELPEDADCVDSRGADFSLLLQGKSSAVSQFRFADELDLDADLERSSLVQSSLTIDPHDLAAAFQCIPLHTKLNLDEKYFQEDEIQIAKKEAESYRELYEKRMLSNSGTTEETMKAVADENYVMRGDNVDLNHVLDDKYLENISENVKMINSDDLVSEQQSNTELPVNAIEDLDEILAATNFTEVDICQDEPCKNSHDVHSIGDIPQDDRVKVSISCNESNPVNSSHSASGKTENITNLEDELDELLSFDGEIQMNKEKTGVVCSETKLLSTTNDTETKDLEDWLDSVLDS